MVIKFSEWMLCSRVQHYVLPSFMHVLRPDMTHAHIAQKLRRHMFLILCMSVGLIRQIYACLEV